MFLYGTRRLDLWRNPRADKWLGELDYADDSDCKPVLPGYFPKAVELIVLAMEFGMVGSVEAGPPINNSTRGRHYFYECLAHTRI